MNLSEGEKKRLHPVAALIATLAALRSLLPVIIVAAFSQRAHGAMMLLAVAVPSLVFSLLIGIGSWLRFRYWVEAGELRIERGILIRRRVFIPADRIQAIDIRAGMMQRVFGLVSLQVKTAASGAQAELRAISRDEADRVNFALTRGVHGSFHDASRASPGAPAAVADAVPPSSAIEPRYVLSLGRLLLAASTSGRLGVLLSGLGWLYMQVDELVNERIVEVVEVLEIEVSVRPALSMVVIAALLAALFIAWLVSVLAEVARFGGFSVQRSDEQIVISRGLFERREIRVGLDRVQAILIVDDLLRQPLGYVSLIVESAGHSEERGQSTQLHPMLKRNEVMPFLRQMVPAFAVEPELLGPPRRAVRRFLIKPMVFAAFAVLAVAISVPSGWLLSPLLGLALVLGVLRFRDSAAGTAGRVLVLRRRRLRRVTAILERHRVQFASVRRSWFQRRLELADFSVGAASGASGRRYIAPELERARAVELLDWCAPPA